MSTLNFGVHSPPSHLAKDLGVSASIAEEHRPIADQASAGLPFPSTCSSRCSSSSSDLDFEDVEYMLPGMRSVTARGHLTGGDVSNEAVPAAYQ